MKIGFIHNPSHPQLQPDYFSLQRYRFFVKAMPTVCEFVPVTNNVVNMDDYDALIYNGLRDIDIPEDIHYTGDKCFKAAFSNDCHRVDADFKQRCVNHGIDLLFYHWPEKAYRRYWLDGVQYMQVFMNLEPELYLNVIPYQDRYKKKILNSGAIHDQEHYKLRIMLLSNNSCVYVPKKNYFIGDNYTHLLQNYRAAIGACTTTTVNKYLQIMASGCLLFAECNDLNGWEELGLADGKNCVMINEDNYQIKIAEYMSDVDNPKWEEIAENGRDDALDYFSMYDEAKRLVGCIRGNV